MLSALCLPSRAAALSAVILGCLAATTPATAQLRPAMAPIEEQIVERVGDGNREALTLLRRVVDINSGTMNLAGVRRVGRVFEEEFDQLGFTTRWIDGSDVHRAGHLVAERPGRGKGSLKVLLIGHLDTVFEPDSPLQSFERLEGRRARGPGITDMKGGNVVLLHALKALQAVGVLDDLHVTVVLTGDEEKAGRPLERSRRALREAAAGAAVALGFEDGDGDPKTAVIARRGSSSWTLRVTGVASHSSQIFTDKIGAGAIYEASRILTEFYEQLSGEPNLTFSPGVILGGTQVDFDRAQGRGSAFGKNNVVAEHAVVSGDLRAITPQQYDRATAAMRTIVGQHLPQTDAKFNLAPGYPPMAASPGNRRLLALYDRVSRDLGYGAVSAVDPRNAGAADVSFVAGQVPMALDGIGLMGTGGHTVDETADLTTLPMQTQRAAVLLYRLGRQVRR